MAEVQGIAPTDLPPTNLPGPLDLERLRVENEALRAQLAASETIAEERRQRIDDLTAALQGLPQAWIEYLERTGRLTSPDEETQVEERGPSTVIEVVAARSPGRPSEEELVAAQAAWQEIRRLRDRLERERIDREIERIRTRNHTRSSRDGLRPAS